MMEDYIYFRRVVNGVMDLSIPVKLKKRSMTFDDYCTKVKSEQQYSISLLNSPDLIWNFPDSLKHKINYSGDILPFYGDTVAAKLHNVEIHTLCEFQYKLYENLSNIFSEKLSYQYFHITVHDLSSAQNKELVQEKTFKNNIHCKKIFKKLADYFTNHPEHLNVELLPTTIYPSCNISVVMGFIPASDKDFRVIMNLYNLFDEVVYLDYWLRLHVTLAYFKPCFFSLPEINVLYDTLKSFNKFDFSIKINLFNLAYQIFDDMNTYSDVFLISDFK